MKLSIEIVMDNAAFEDPNGAEAARILAALAAKMEGGDLSAGDGGRLMDYNGNSCGAWSVSE
jgi:hypothetical protein